MPSAFYPLYSNGTLHPQAEKLLRALAAQPGPPLHTLTPAQVRESNSIAQWVAPYEPAASTKDVTIASEHGSIPARLYTPSGTGPFPILIYFHGGGFVFGNLDQADHVCATLSRRGECLVVSVDYRLAPEHRFPAAVHDAIAALAGVATEAREMGGDPTRIAVGGESAGANLAAVVARHARDPGVPPLSLQLLLSPWVEMGDFDTESYRLFGDGPWLPRRNMEYYRDQYLGDLSHARDARASPLRVESFRSLPPAHIITAELDVLRDEGEAYAARLAAAGVPTTLTRYPGMIHSFFLLTGVLEDARKALLECGDRLREAFGARKPASETGSAR